MAITVQHSPSAGTAGSVARQAGLGQYSKFMQQMIAQENNQRAQRQQQAQMQQAQIEAQRQRDADYQSFQRLEKQNDLEMKKEYAEFSADLNQGVQQETMDRNLVGNGWQEYVGSIKNWDDWSPQQKNGFQAEQNAVQQVLMHKGLRPEEKAYAIRQAMQKIDAIRQSVVPKQKTQQEQWKLQGKGIGDTWINEMTGDTETRDNSGNVKVLKKAITASEYSKAYSDVAKAITDAKSGVAPKHEDIVERLDRMGIRMYRRPDQQQFPNPETDFIDTTMNQGQQEQGPVPYRSIPGQSPVGPPPNEGARQAQTSQLDAQRVEELGAFNSMFPQTVQALNLDADMVRNMPQDMIKDLEVLEKGLEYVSKVPRDREKARKVRDMVMKFQAILGRK